MTTPHIEATRGDFSDTVIVAGDPLRVKYIAETYFENVSLVTSVRNMLGYTGWYKGRRLSVMSHGMGGPSAAIYCTELITNFDVKNLIRVGTCGSISTAVKLREIVIATAASTDSHFNRYRFDGMDYAAAADYTLLQHLITSGQLGDATIHISQVFSSDFFYHCRFDHVRESLANFKIPVIEMEVATIYSIAAEYGARAAAMCTVTDNIVTGERLSADERSSGVDEMITIALNAAVQVNNDEPDLVATAS